MTTSIQLYNSMARRKEAFEPMNPEHVKMYVCGPTVYNRPHIGNARSVVVYDVLYRLLMHCYGTDAVTYARNITDVDDKINAAAKERGISIQALTEEVTQQFHDDMDALGCLRPTVEPKATEHIAEIIDMIGRLIEQGHAYEADGHVLFDVTSDREYGRLSGRAIDEQEAGARIAVEDYKRHPGDFVLWKPADAEDDTSSRFDSPWGEGRPGWHIECSAMATRYLGETFDIHGGGADLKFPHHENEIAQSCGANPGSDFARYWVHNGFLTVEGEKMSKSLGNFITVHELLEQGVHGEVIRLALLSAKYNEPLDWNRKLIEDSRSALDKMYRILQNAGISKDAQYLSQMIEDAKNGNEEDPEAIYLLKNDLNVPALISKMHKWVTVQNSNPDGRLHTKIPAMQLKAAGEVLGLFNEDPEIWFRGNNSDSAEVEAQIAARAEAKQNKDWAKADAIRDALSAEGIILEDRPDGTTDWRRY